MGVRGLWEVVAPAAKPVQLEDLRGQRVAVDASIWIYHFMKAVRDSNGEVLRNAHVIGFFRRICKLIYFGIKPVFVFDGGAPSLKRQTINRRKERREFRQEDAARTAAKLLTVQLERMANQQVHSNKKQKTKANKKDDDQEFVYFDERNLPESTRVGVTSTKKEKPFRPQDPYHLPEVDEEKPVKSDDPRLMTQEELAEYAQEFEAQINTGLYDVSILVSRSSFELSPTPGLAFLFSQKQKQETFLFCFPIFDNVGPNRTDCQKRSKTRLVRFAESYGLPRTGCCRPRDFWRLGLPGNSQLSCLQRY
jgi:DNA excision repair protein ERCC-5